MDALQRSSDHPGIGGQLAGVMAAGVAALSVFAGIVLCARAWEGSFDHSLGMQGLAGAGALLLVAGELVAYLSRRWSKPPQGFRQAVALAPAAGAALCCVGLSTSAAPPAGLAALWVAALIEAGLTARRAGCWPMATNHSAPRPADNMATLNGEPLVEAPSFAEAGPGADPERDFETRLEPDVVQQLTRREARDGGQWLCGLVRVRFDAGQRTGHAHVAFCPPFLSTPSCEAEPVDGPDSVVKVAQLVPHGARFEARLDVPAAEPTDVVVEFATHWQPDSGVGATET